MGLGSGFRIRDLGVGFRGFRLYLRVVTWSLKMVPYNL